MGRNSIAPCSTIVRACVYLECNHWNSNYSTQPSYYQKRLKDRSRGSRLLVSSFSDSPICDLLSWDFGWQQRTIATTAGVETRTLLIEKSAMFHPMHCKTLPEDQSHHCVHCVALPCPSAGGPKLQQLSPDDPHCETARSSMMTMENLPS